MTKRRVIVMVKWGPSAFQKAVIEPGSTLWVGRGERADLMIPHDGALSAVHFEIAWDGVVCRLEDLGSQTGVMLGGEKVDVAVVQNGSWIRAGGTIFMVYFERFTPPRWGDLEGPPKPPRSAGYEGGRFVEMTGSPHLAMLLSALKSEGHNLYAVLDASRGGRLLELLRESVDPHRSLFEGTQGDALEDVAPYLVHLQAGSDLLDCLVHEGWGKRWGIYLATPMSFELLRRHLRRFLMVEDDATGAPLFFRYYDPATLRVYVPAASRRQTAQLFGEIDRFWVEGKEGELIALERSTYVAGAPSDEARP